MQLGVRSMPGMLWLYIMTKTCSLDNEAAELQCWRLRENFLSRRNYLSLLCYDKKKKKNQVQSFVEPELSQSRHTVNDPVCFALFQQQLWKRINRKKILPLFSNFHSGAK